MISYRTPIQPKFKYVVISRTDDTTVLATFSTANEALDCCTTMHHCYVAQMPV